MPPKVLLVGWTDPVSAPSGFKLRFDATVRGLSAVGRVDYLQWAARSWHWPPSHRSPNLEHDLPFTEQTLAERITLPSRAVPAFHRMCDALHLDAVPPEVRVAAAPRGRDYARVGLRSYDLVWCSGLASALSVHRHAPAGPAVIADLVDLWPGPAGATACRAVYHWAAATVLSNPGEADSLGASVVVIENGADLPGSVERHAADRVTRVLFVGWMHYPPNAYAAAFVAHDVVPELRALLGPDFEVRLVGRAPAEVEALSALPNVTVTGFVHDLAAELLAADVAIVPLFAGTGTRTKILEAFAYGVPVVSTTLGAAGLAVEHERDLLIADDARSLAAACVRVARDTQLRDRLVRSARELVETRYDWRIIESTIAQTAADVMERFPNHTAQG